MGYCCPVYTSGNQGAHTRKRTSPFSPSPRSFRSGPPCFSYLVNILGALQVLGVDPECRAITCGAQPFPSTLLVLGGDWSSGSGPGLGAVSGCEPGLGTVVVDRDWVPRVVVGLDWAQWHVPAHRGCSYSIKSEFYLHRSHRIHSPESSVRTVSWR